MVSLAGVFLVLAALGSTACTGGRAEPRTATPTPSDRSLVPDTAACVRFLHVRCYVPAQLQRAYDLEPLYKRHLNGTGETIAIVVSFGSPTIRDDLARFDRDYGLPGPPSFRTIQPSGAVPSFDASNPSMFGWARETSLDVEWAHAMAPGASILLVETPVAETEGAHGLPQMIHAENYVIDHNMADIISQSFGATEETFARRRSILGLRSAYRNARAHGVTVLAPTSDQGPTSYVKTVDGFFARRVIDWPGSDPLVTAVGGTTLHLDASGNRIGPDTVWNETFDPKVSDHPPAPAASGGGLSSVFPRPPYQDGVRNVVGDSRGVPDVSLSAAHAGSVVVYEGFRSENSGYFLAYGDSEAVPEFAGVVAIADQAAGHRLGLLNPILYALAAGHAPGIVDVTEGNNNVSFRQNGAVLSVAGWVATPGYDLASGLGTIDAAKLVDELAAAA